MKIVVTGAAGFVGAHLLRALSELKDAGATIVPTAKDGFESSSGTSFLPLDISQPQAVDAFVKEHRPTHLVHLAGVPSIGAVRANPAAAWQVNVLGTLDLARAVLAHAPDCTFIFAGSSECYGASALKGEALSETDLLQPLNEYAATKGAADLALGALAANGLKAIRFRPFNHTGPGQTPDFVIPAFASQIAQIEKGELPPVIRVGNLNARRDFLDVRDVVAAYAAAIRNSGDVEGGTVMNLASGQARMIGDILDELLQQSSSKIEVLPDPARMRAIDVPVSFGCSRVAQASLGWLPQRPFKQTLGDVLEFFRKGR